MGHGLIRDIISQFNVASSETFAMADQAIPEPLRTSLQCKACLKFLRPPIRMCKNGHNVCDLCKKARDSKCPVCPDNIMDISNAELEALIKHFGAPISCKYGEAGCDWSNVLDETLLHEEDCHFRPIKCLVMSCKADITLHGLENHMTEKHQEMIDGKWVITKHEPDMDELASLMVPGTYVVRGRDWNKGDRDGNPPGSGVIIGPYPGRPDLVQVRWNHGSTNASCYRMGNGFYDLKLATSQEVLAIRTWRHSDVRFFATLFLGGDDFWHIMVSAACGKNTAAKFRAEIRLASQDVPECSNLYYRPVEHLETEILTSNMNKYKACLDVHKEDVKKQTEGKVASLKIKPGDIPFTCKVYEKVFVTFDKEDIEEKEN